MRNYEWCAYTYRHRKALGYILEKLIQEPDLKIEMQKRAKIHDVDKMLLYLFCDQTEAQSWHVHHQPHHLESGLGTTYYDLVETILDYECAPYTKPDKPLNAFDFVNKLTEMGYLERKKSKELIEIMHEFGIDYSYEVTRDTEGLAFVKQFELVTEEMILQEILQYVRENPDSSALVYLDSRAE